MTLLESEYDEVMLHLRYAWKVMKKFTDMAKHDYSNMILLEEDFRRARRSFREFARVHYGILPRRDRKPRQRRCGTWRQV